MLSRLAALALACAALIAASCGDGGAEPPAPATAAATATPTSTPQRATIGLLDDALVDVDEPAPDFQELWEARGPAGPDDLVILAVNLSPTDTRAAATAFVEEYGLTFPIMFDTPRGEVARHYGVQALPATFFIDRDGVVRTTALGTVFGHLLEVGVADADTAGGTYD